MEKINILLADQQTDFQSAISSYFRPQYEINCLTPPAFDDLFKKPYLNFSIAIIDSGFSGSRGLEAIEVLKTSNPSRPIIFTTSQDTEQLCLCAYKLGTRDCFKKPYLLIDIIRSIELILKSKKERTGYRSNILLGKYANNLASESALQNNHPSIEKAKRYMEENFNKNFSIEHLAKKVCTSKFHFSRIFKKEIGITCTEYLNKVRITKAKNLLKNDQLSISEICFLTGFNDLTYFGKVFKTLEGVSPSTYRKNLTTNQYNFNRRERKDRRGE